ncbi:MAG: type II secretion system secretin GspD, partial [Planctomycetes bacterium]|nr:type II secretion system secretin GspD [Planctomycetota bacterium]
MKPIKRKIITLFTKVILIQIYLIFLLTTGCQSEINKPGGFSESLAEKKITYGPDTVVIDPKTAQLLKNNSRPSLSAQNDVISGAGEYEDVTEPSILQHGTNGDIDKALAAIPDRLLNDQGNTVLPDEQSQAVDSDHVGSDSNANTSEQQNPNQDIVPEVGFPTLYDPNLAFTPISVNFNEADIGQVIKTISDITGINFIVDDNITGTVTVHSPTDIQLGELYQFLESILEVTGFAAIPSQDHVKIIPRAQAHQHNLHMRVGCDPSQIPLNDSIVNQLMPLKYADAVEIGNLIQPRLSVSSHLTVYPKTNAILITDTSSNIHQVARIIQQLDVPGAQQEQAVIALTYASAQALARQITQIVDRYNTDSVRPRGSAQTIRMPSLAQVEAVERTNSLIVIANRHTMGFIKDLVNRLDVARPVGTDNMHVEFLKYAQAKPTAENLSAAIANLSSARPDDPRPPINIIPDESTNALIIHASQQDYQIIAGIINKIDIPREQVLVELFIMEVSEETLREIGIDWATLDQAVADSVRFFGGTNFGVRVDSASDNLEGLSVGAFKEVGGEVQIGSILSALEKESGVNILSKPHILTSNHQTAEIFVGETVPFLEQNRIEQNAPTTQPIIQTYKYTDVGVSLNIIPHINQGRQVSLEIDSKFTQISENLSLSAEIPTTATRQIKTSISMPNGQTVVIGGLIRDDKITIEKKIPLLGDLPLLGGLFKFRRDRIQKTNLLLFITPYIINNQPATPAA